MSTLHERYLREVISMALENVRSGRGGPFGALILLNGEVIGRGTNLVTATNDPTAHAEINAIRDACRSLGTFRLDGAILYASCEPCPMCLGAIYWGRIERVCYAGTRDDAAGAGFDDAAIYREFICDPTERSILLERIVLEGVEEPFRAWSSRNNRIDY